MLQNENVIEIATRLKKENIPITEKNIYLAHFNGIPFVLDVLDPKNIDKTIGELPSWGKTAEERKQKTDSNPKRAAQTVRSYLEVVRNFESKPYKLEDFGESARRYQQNPGSKRNGEVITELQELYGDKRSYKILTNPTLSVYEDFAGKHFEKNQYGEIIPKKIIPTKEKPDKQKVSIFINAGQTILASNKPNSSLSIPTDPDNNVYYPYAA
jgi:hypothetical protein